MVLNAPPARRSGSEGEPLRVALLTAAETWSGIEVHTIHLASALKKRGHDVSIVELGRRRYVGDVMPLPCPVLHLDLGLGDREGLPLGLLGFRAWRRLLGSIEADIAVVAKGTFKFGSVAMEAAGRLRFKRFLVIEHLHAPLLRSPRRRHLKGLVPGLGLWWYREKVSGYLRSVFPHRIICVSHAVASTLQKDYGYPHSKLITAHSGVDTSVFAPNPVLRKLARDAWGVPDAAFVFGTLGRLSPVKNHAQLISAFSLLCDCSGGRDMRLVIVGDGPLRPSLEALADSNGVRERVVFGGFTRDPQNMLPGFDVFCLPSTTGEAFGIALLEAMACECPPIAAAVGGVPEILDDSRLGWLIRSGDETELLSAMRLAVDLDSVALQQIGVNARQRVMSSFNSIDRWDELAAVIEAAYAGRGR